FVDLKCDTDLKRLQNDILNSISPSFPVKEDASFKGDRADNSVLLHSCFNRLREIEVLKDQLLFLLSKDPTLKPNDILVMAPEIEVYAGLIDAVFDVEHNREDFISYVIADRSIKNESIALKSLFQILELPQKRLSVSQVVELLFFQPVREKYNISLDDLDIILNWVKKSGIRWGIDKEHRQAWNYPDSFENTWRFGLNRLFLSISIPSNEDEIFVDTLPFGEIESEKAVILGNFAEFLEDIFSWVEKLSKNSKIRDWEAIILEIAEKSILFKIEDAWASSLLSEALNEIIKDSELADFNENISLKVIKTILDQRLQSTLPHHHFTAQGITFCGMKPMRNIPFKVICLIGMNENDFPRKDSSLSFDLMRHERRPGDPERSMEDRYLFLEALLAAQDHFVVTYLGKNPLDGRSLSPSNVVYDLLESLADTLNPRADQVEDFNDARLEKEKIKESFIVQHPLEAFHPIYFNPDHPRHFSFSNENALAAKNLLGLKKRKTPFIDKTLPRLNSTEEIPLRDFTRFFKDPGAFFLSKRFELYLKEENFVLEDLEPIDLCGLDFYQAATLWLKRYPLDKGGVKTFERLQKSGILPFGTLGQVRYDKLNDRAGNLISELNRYSPESFQPKQYEVKVILDHNIRLFGSDTDFFTQDGLAILTPSKEKAKNLIECWIKHLLLSCMNDKKAYRKLVYIYWNKDKINAESKIFDEIADPGKHLADLVDLYLLGQNEPLAFFPETSLAYAREIFNLKGSSDETTALNKARKVWDADNGDGKQESNRLLYAGLDVFNLLTLDLDVPFHGDFTPTHDFQDLAKSIFQPMLECLK
ncbi:MAG: exodeoxyribonuclease V subunit gamma, partial [Deltaproteobacteria bacterium]|nr:exodeoxyribonuclease V subunit gamma [Deltaproteobacteria bacterium]